MLASTSRAMLARRLPLPLRWVLLLAALAACIPAWAQTTPLADAPLFSTVNAPGNLAMVLSVEFPTAVSVAHSNRTYSATSTYLGYFDEAKCYTYSASPSDTTLSPSATPGSWFVPAAAAASHVCSGQWSGNFLNWASMQTIDTFRWVLTGGFRAVDTSSLTVLEKAWASNQGNLTNFPDSSIPAAAVAGATPFGSLVTGGATALNLRIYGLGNQLRFYVAAPALKYAVKYYNCTDFSCAAITPSPSTVTDFSALVNNTSPATGVNSSNFGARYTTTVIVPQTGTYTFGLLADDGASLYLNDSTTAIATANYYNSVAVSKPNPGGSLTLNAGDTLSIRADYYQYYGDAALGLYWKLPGSSDFTPIGPSGGTLTSNSLDYKGGKVAPNTTYNAFMRGKVCDATVGLEANCVAYSGGYKPEGLMQKYANKLRYSAFGYLNDSTTTRDAGVLRAAQKFIGPTQPVYGAPAVTNLAAEWDATSGVMAADPDCSTSNPSRPADPQCPSSGTVSSGAMNYINKFGELLHNGYKGYDPVSELYYAAVRYFKNLGNVHEWSDMAADKRAAQMDGFPVITSWTDPIIGSCQKNFVLGIGDTHTWYDKDVPGNANTSGEPSPTPALGDTTVDAVAATNKVGVMEFSAPSRTLGTESPYVPTGGGGGNSALIAGLAYDAHTTGIRSYTDAAGNKKAQTLDTYWLDVQEGNHYEPNNQYYLATKYGGFKVPDGYKPYDAGTTTLDPSTWWNGVDYLSYGSTTNKRPNNYYSAGQPDQMQAGLIAAFADAAATSTNSYSTSFALPVPQVGPDGSASFAATYLPSTWSGDLIASKLTFDASGAPVSSAAVWSFADKLRAQAAGTGISRLIVTWNGTTGAPFELPTASPPGITSTQLSKLDTSYISGNDSADYLQYLRGNTSHEISSTGADGTHYYRTRVGPLGDIVNSTPVVVGAPAFPYGDSSNPGYNAFKTQSPARSTVVYVGANDGMLHAVDGSITASTGGNELFAFVPSALFNGPNSTPSVDGLASLGNPAFVHHYMVDGPLAYFDIDFARTVVSGSASPSWTSSTTPMWRTVLIGALGKGGKSYYAIDITDPSTMTSEAAVASKVLWEYSNAASLGYTYGKPVVVKVRKYGWVVALPSGYNNGDGYGHIIFLNPQTGAFLEDVKTPTTSNGLAQLNAYILDPTDGTVDAFYAGDLDGNLWRLDVTQTTTAAFPAPVKIASFISPATSTLAATAQPITTVPFVQIDPDTRRRFVLVGTGRLLDTSDISSAQVQTFYAIWDGDNVAFSAAPTGGGSFPIRRAQLLPRSATDTTSGAAKLTFGTNSGWYTDLVATYLTDSKDPTTAVTLQPRLVSQMTTGYGQVAFAATVPLGTMCSPSGSSVDYAFAYGAAQSTLLNTDSVTLPYVVLSNVTTSNIGFTSNNGELALIYGVTSSGAKNNLRVSGLLSKQPRRVNWREVPLVD